MTQHRFLTQVTRPELFLISGTLLTVIFFLYLGVFLSGGMESYTPAAEPITGIEETIAPLPWEYVPPEDFSDIGGPVV